MRASGTVCVFLRIESSCTSLLQYFEVKYLAAWSLCGQTLAHLQIFIVWLHWLIVQISEENSFHLYKKKELQADRKSVV